MAHRPSRSAACGIFPDQGSNLCPLHWQADSQPLRHQGNPPISFIVGLLVMNALGCLSSENVFTSSSFRKDIFTGYRIRLFSFDTLKMLFHCLLASIVSNEKSIVIWISVPLCGMHCFLFCFVLGFLAACKIFSLSLGFNSLITMYLGVDFVEFLLFGIPWTSWICKFDFCNIWEVFGYFFFKYFFVTRSPLPLRL